MTQPFTPRASLTRESAGQSIQRTLIVTLGPLASAVHDRLVPTFGEQSTLSHAIALLDVDSPEADWSSAIHSSLVSISRRGGRAELSAGGYALDRLQELALLVVVDLGGPAAVARVRSLLTEVAGMARDGWGLDTHSSLIALAEDWAAPLAREGLRALMDVAREHDAPVMPINRVNEQGFELDGAEALAGVVAAVVEALVATPLRDVLYGAGDEAGLGPTGGALTTVGLARWLWEPESVADTLAEAWRNRVLDQWLAAVDADRTAPVVQRADAWLGAHGLLPPALTARLERSVTAYDVPAWPVPYPWEAAEAVDRLRSLSEAMAGGRAGAVDLVLEDWTVWQGEQEAVLRGELAAQLDQEPIAGVALGGRFLKELAHVVFDAGGVVAHRQEQLEEQMGVLDGQVRRLLAEIDAMVSQWPSGGGAAWLGLLLRPWRWPGLVWETYALHNLAGELAARVARQAMVEREQVVVAAAAALYERFEAAIERTAAHLEEAADMLAAGRGDTRLALSAPVGVGRLAARESPELEAAEAAAALGGLGRLAGEIDEALVTALHELSRRRFQFLIEMPAVAALERMLADGEAVAAWWEALWAEATPLWLFDDAGQPEDSRGAARHQTAVCALGVELLRELLGEGARPGWRWLPSVDGRWIHVMRWRTGVRP